MGLKVAYTLGTIEPTLTKVTIPKNIEVHKDIVYKIIDTTALKLDIYSPKALKNEAPLIIFIHGGAWEKGKKSNVLHYLISYANKGYITARCSHIFNIIQIYSLKNI
ncbi:hypothetical protein DHC50_11510 [Arenibacter sp. A80]|nr:hypothetical protein [Arenibacter sp. A80]RFT56251.1 hypothetical protein D0S24_11510 [Arenibacter sp. P308M17]